MTSCVSPSFIYTCKDQIILSSKLSSMMKVDKMQSFSLVFAPEKEDKAVISCSVKNSASKYLINFFYTICIQE